MEESVQSGVGGRRSRGGSGGWEGDHHAGEGRRAEQGEAEGRHRAGEEGQGGDAAAAVAGSPRLQRGAKERGTAQQRRCERFSPVVVIGLPPALSRACSCQLLHRFTGHLHLPSRHPLRSLYRRADSAAALLPSPVVFLLLPFFVLLRQAASPGHQRLSAGEAAVRTGVRLGLPLLPPARIAFSLSFICTIGLLLFSVISLHLLVRRALCSAAAPHPLPAGGVVIASASSPSYPLAFVSAPLPPPFIVSDPAGDRGCSIHQSSATRYAATFAVSPVVDLHSSHPLAGERLEELWCVGCDGGGRAESVEADGRGPADRGYGLAARSGHAHLLSGGGQRRREGGRQALLAGHAGGQSQASLASLRHRREAAAASIQAAQTPHRRQQRGRRRGHERRPPPAPPSRQASPGHSVPNITPHSPAVTTRTR